MKLLLIIIFAIVPVFAQTNPFPKPAIQQAKAYKAVSDISQYWISEKLDGMRGYWNGSQLLTRQGNIINSPTWFTKNWPNKPMDGELWIKRDYFQQTISCIRKLAIDEACWESVRFMLFDLPSHSGTFTERILAMEKLIKNINSSYLSMIKQFKVTTIKELEQTLNEIVRNNGEGLMLHQGNAYYHIGRTAKIMKLKKYQDAEAMVVAHLAGNGKYRGALGAIKVKTKEGIIFKIGSGFTDYERNNPPKIGSIITYQYNGNTRAGIPRFARFLRVRE